MSSPGAPSRRQKRMGPAPFASFEDLSDELDSPEDKNAQGSVVRLPGIREDVTPCSPAPTAHQIKAEFVYTGISLIGAPSTPTIGSTTPMAQNGRTICLQAPAAPRIDISRASSSSHHDSKDSSPEREDGSNVKLGMGFKEEGTVDLRSSTEELDFQEQQKAAKGKVVDEDSYHSHNRKDSQSSEVGLLCISGRTSRLSSIGSQGSAQSRVSNASHLSVISGQSGVSRSPSPHKMLLETSFCGTKPQKEADAAVKDDGTKEDLEKVLLSRKHDPTQALFAEGITVKSPKPQPPERKRPPQQVAKKIQPPQPQQLQQPQQKPQQPPQPEITIKVDKPTNDILQPKLPKYIVSESGIEYIYIPLKGPLPDDPKVPPTNGAVTKLKVRETKSASFASRSLPKEAPKPKSKSASPSPLVTRHGEDPQYIRIKLKPDHLYEDYKPGELQKPDSLDLNESPRKPPQSFEQIMSYRTESPQFTTPTASPKPVRHLREPVANSKSPSPSLSRKSSFASIFKSRETISPESPTAFHRRKNTPSGERRRSRSKSRERGPSSTESIDSKGRPKSVFSLFKSKKNDTSSPELPNLRSLAVKSPKPLKYHEPPLDGESVRIPLHSPTYYENKNLLQDFKTSSQDSQETVIEVAPKSETCSAVANRQSSTSSENLVFSTRLGSNNDLFTTKLPKRKNDEVTTVIVEAASSPVRVEPLKVSPVRAEPVKVSPVKESRPPPTPPRRFSKESMTSPKERKASPGKETPPKRVPSKESVTSPKEPVARRVPSKRRLSKQQPTNEDVTPTNEVQPKLDDEILVKAKLVERPEEKPAKPTVVSIEPKQPSPQEPPHTLPQKSSSREDDRYSSESERDSEANFPVETAEPERKGLVLQQDSFEDELPYIPTTLPQERSVALPIVPIKQRSTYEMRTYPIERPRSTTPINPTCLEDYCEDVVTAISAETISKTIEKLKISLPKDEEKPKSKSPRRTGSGTWFDFSKIAQPEPPPPPLPPKGLQKEWINFEDIPERRKPPKRIQTIPSRGNIEVAEPPLQENVIYTYVNPEDCKCECHERAANPGHHQAGDEDEGAVREDEMPLLEDDSHEEDKVERVKLDVTILDRRSIVSDSSVDLSGVADHQEANGIDHSLRTPFTSDLGVSSNRSSIVSQDDALTPDTDSPNAFPKSNLTK